MWQRAQTLYLAVATILIAVMLFGTKAVIVGGDGSVVATIKYSAYLPYLILLVIIGLLELLALTTYKFRIFQLRTAGLASLITLALLVWLGIDFAMTHNEAVFRLTAVFPVVSIILNVLAMRGILADEMMVESAYHLRKSRRERRKSR